MKRLLTCMLTLCLFAGCATRVTSDHVCKEFGKWELTSKYYYERDDIEQRTCIECGHMQRRKPEHLTGEK